MDRQKVWQTLGIDETKDPALIKEAYRKQLMHTNPEDDAQGFMNLRNAYEEAMRLSCLPERGEVQETEKDDIDLWVDRVDNIYQDIYKRRNIALWEELLKDPVCSGLDTWLKAREKLLAYLMNHFYLPHGAWLVLDRTFDVVKDEEKLFQIFPRDFIGYVVRQVGNYSAIDLDLFTSDGSGSIDEYIRSYYDIKRMVDEGKTEDLPGEFQKIGGKGIYHPYIDAERLRYFIALDHQGEIQKLIHPLSAFLSDGYIAYYVARAHWILAQYDEAAAIWESLCRKHPNHYGAWVGRIEYYIHKGQYKEANEHAVDLLKIYVGDTELHRLLLKANESLIKEYEEVCKTNPGDMETKKELAWCYYQNSYMDQCLQVLKEFPKETDRESWYLKIHGYVYGKKSEFKRAQEYFFQWLALLKSSRESEDYEKYFGHCNYMIGICYIQEEAYEKAIPYLKEAASFEKEGEDRLRSMERLAFACLKSGRNEKCIDECDKIIAQSEGYYPAYLHRQEAYFNMRNGQGVVDDYHKAVEIFPGHVKPYLLAAKVYFFYRQYEDSMNVINRATAANLSSNELALFCGKNMRALAQDKENEEAALKVFLDLAEKMKNSANNNGTESNSAGHNKGESNKEEDEFQDLAEVYHEAAKAYADLGQFEEGLETINKAIKLNAGDDYYTTKAYLYMDLEMYRPALEILERMATTYPEAEYIHVSLAKCYEKADQEEQALTFYKKTLDINPDNIRALEAIGDIYIDLYQRKEDVKYYEMAAPYAQRLIEVQPTSYYYIHAGIIYEKGYEFEKALECCRKAAECEPGNMWPHNNAGYVLKIMKRYDEAIQAYQKAIELMEPGQSLLPHSNLADCYEILGRYEEAMACYQEILKHWPDNKAIHKDMAGILEHMEKYQEAANVYLDMIKKYNFSKEEAYYKIMDIYENAENFRKATSYATKAVLMDSNSPVVFKKVGEFYFNIGKLRRAKNFTKRAVQNIKSKESEQYSSCCLTLAQIYLDEGKAEKARHWADRALSAIRSVYGGEETFIAYRPYSGLHHYRMGMIFTILGDYEKAEQHFTAAIENLPCKSCRTTGCFEGYYGLGRLYEEKGELDRAEECYQKAFELCKCALFKRCLRGVAKKRNNVKDTLLDKIWRYI